MLSFETVFFLDLRRDIFIFDYSPNFEMFGSSSIIFLEFLNITIHSITFDNSLFNINLKLVMAEENADGSSKAVYRTIFGAEFLWPLDCPDDIIESTVQEIKNLENN